MRMRTTQPRKTSRRRRTQPRRRRKRTQLTVSMRRRAGLTCANHKLIHANHEEEMGCAQAGFVEHEKEGWADPRGSGGGFALTCEDHEDRRSRTDTL